MGVIAAGFVIGAGAAAVKWAGDFQAGMNTINSVALATPGVLDKAGAGLRDIFRTTGQSMDDLQAAEYDLVSAGIKLADSQKGVDTAVRLGIGSLGTTSEAVDVLTTAINSYNLKAKDGSVATSTWARVSDELAQAVADGKVKLSDIASEYAVVAPLAANFGVKTGEIAASLGFLTAKGNSAGESLTQMRSAITEIVKPSDGMAAVLKKLGTSGEALIRKEGLAGALETIRQQAVKLKIPFQDLFGRKEAYLFALQTTGPNAAGFAAELDRIAHSAGMTNKQFDERAQGFNYQLGVLKANVQDAGITIGTALLPKLTEMATKAADFLRGHQRDIKDFATSLADGFEKAATWAEKLDWSAIGTSIKAFAGFGKSLAEGFLALPDDVRSILVGLFAVNKFTGGAVIKVGVDLAGGLASGLSKAVGAGLAGAGLGKLFVQPVFVTNPGGLGGGGGLPTGAAGAAGAAAEGAAGAGIGMTVAAAISAVGAGLGLAAIMALAAELIIKYGKDPTNIGGRTDTADARHVPGRIDPNFAGPRSSAPYGSYRPPSGALSVEDRTLREPLLAAASKLQDVKDASQTTTAQAKHNAANAKADIKSLQQALSYRLGMTNSKLEAIKDKDQSVHVTVKTNVSTRVSVRDVKQAIYTYQNYSISGTNKYQS